MRSAGRGGPRASDRHRIPPLGRRTNEIRASALRTASPLSSRTTTEVPSFVGWDWASECHDVTVLAPLPSIGNTVDLTEVGAVVEDQGSSPEMIIENPHPAGAAA
jgi:hypothetical protein